MDQQMREKIEKIISDRKRAHKFYSEKSDVYNAFIKMENATFIEGKLEKKNKELIAFGISIYRNCESCMEWHMKQALDSGATNEQVLEAVNVGVEMGGGVATVAARFAMHVLEYYTESHA
jgi:AhpD family alkylhydroperoxidase